MDADELGRIRVGNFNSNDFSVYAGVEFWLGKAKELDMAASTLAIFSKALIEKKGEFELDLAVLLRQASRGIVPFPPDPRMGMGVWQAMMLAGFALENVLKAILIRRNPQRISNGRLEGFDHNLVLLSADAGLALSDVEIRLCEICTHAVMVAGRYPTSMKAAGLAENWDINFDIAWPTYETFFARLFEDASS